MTEPDPEHQITLNFLVEGDDPFRQTFEVTVSLDDKFAKVRLAIQQEYRNQEQTNIYSPDLYLGNVSLEQAGQPLSREALLPTIRKVASVWPSNRHVDQDLIHIIVRPKSKQLAHSHKAVAPPNPETEIEQLTNRFNATQLSVVEAALKLNSSSAASPRNFRKQQAGENYINIGRPAERVGLPIVLYHPAFGKFLSRLKSTEPANRTTYGHTRQYFVVSQKLYEDENKGPGSRDTNTRVSLTPLLGASLEKISAGGVTADGVVFGPNASRIVIMEMKNEIGAGGSDPSIQAAESYLRYWGDPLSRHWLTWCCCPSILLAIAGPWMCVLGAIFLDRPVVQPLTDFLWVGDDPARPSDIDTIAKVFDALSLAQSELHGYYNSSNPPQPAVYNTAREFPYLTHYLDSKGQQVDFKYRQSLCPDHPNKPIFLADTLERNPKTIVVKFVQNYNSEAHKLLAENKLAPQLLYDGTMHPDDQPGPEHAMIVMELVKGVPLASRTPMRLSASEFDDIQKAVELLHDNDFVFGDLRAPNIMLLQNPPGEMTERAMLIDFDWCGKHAEDRYPPRMNTLIQWHGDVGPRVVMKKEHDIFLLDMMRQYWLV